MVNAFVDHAFDGETFEITAAATLRDGRVTLPGEADARLSRVEASSVETDVGNERSVLRTPRKHPSPSPSTEVHSIP